MYHLAELNIARMKFGMDDPGMADFVDALDPVNASADAQPGFVWRLQSDIESDPALQAFEAAGWLVNLSVWENLESLRAFVTTPLHLSIMKRRAEWFEKQARATLVLWWVKKGHIPGFEEAMARLEQLRERGPGPDAFGFERPFPHP